MKKISSAEQKWTLEIVAGKYTKPFITSDFNKYIDLIIVFVKRDLWSVYKQTILGPLWIVIQPILTTLIFALVFGKIARIPTDGIPHILYYLCGVTFWTYFASTFTATANLFVTNQYLFSKVFFPRLIVVISSTISHGIKFLIQFLLFVIIYAYSYTELIQQHLSFNFILLPVYVFLFTLFAVGAGLIFATLTVKYRDMRLLLTFGVQLLLYATPVIYSFQTVPEEIKGWIILNPLVPIFEGIKNSIFSTEYAAIVHLPQAMVITIVTLMVGMYSFIRIEHRFVDDI